MEPDDVFSARFDIHTADLPLGKNDIGFKAEFRDTEGRFFESEVYVISIDVVERLDEPAPMIMPMIAMLLIVIGLTAGFFMYRRKQRNKRI